MENEDEGKTTEIPIKEESPVKYLVAFLLFSVIGVAIANDVSTSQPSTSTPTVEAVQSQLPTDPNLTPAGNVPLEADAVKVPAKPSVSVSPPVAKVDQPKEKKKKEKGTTYEAFDAESYQIEQDIKYNNEKSARDLADTKKNLELAQSIAHQDSNDKKTCMPNFSNPYNPICSTKIEIPKPIKQVPFNDVVKIEPKKTCHTTSGLIQGTICN